MVFALYAPMMQKRKILIIDDAGFSRVCSAILESEGYATDVMTKEAQDLSGTLHRNEFGLVVMSYPYADEHMEEIQRRKIPTVILATHIDPDLIILLESFKGTYCMIKPLNYQKFTSVVRQVMSGDFITNGGYNIV